MITLWHVDVGRGSPDRVSDPYSSIDNSIGSPQSLSKLSAEESYRQPEITGCAGVGTQPELTGCAGVGTVCLCSILVASTNQYM